MVKIHQKIKFLYYGIRISHAMSYVFATCNNNKIKIKPDLELNIERKE